MRRVSAVVKTKYRVACKSILLGGNLVNEGDILEGHELGDQLQAHIDAGHVEAFEDVAVTGEPEPTPEKNPVEKPEVSNRRTPPSKAKPTPEKNPVEKPEVSIENISDLPDMDDALLAALESAGCTTIEDLRSLKAEEIADLGGISVDRATKLLDSTGG